MDGKEAYPLIASEMKKLIAGNEDIIRLMFIAIIADGHCILEGVPGLAKTEMTKTLARAINAEFARIQGTPDLDMRNISGFTYIDDEEHEIKVKKGPIFTNILLLDELNRMPPRTMAGFLEALEERQVTIPGAQTMKLNQPFIAFATQNPLFIEGTNPIPKVMTDRFLMRIAVSYPTNDQEMEMLKLKEHASEVAIKQVIDISDILRMQKESMKVKMTDEFNKYVTKLVDFTREEQHVVMGAGPRAEIALMKCAKANAYIEGRPEITIEDAKYLAKPVLSHRLVVRSTGGIGVNGIIDGIVKNLIA